MRRDFVTNASHELKTPVAGIQVLAEALDVIFDRDRGRARDLVRRLHDEAERLGRLVHELLDLRRLEEDGVSAHRTPVDLAALIRTVAMRAAATAAKAGVEVRLDLPDRAVVAGVGEDLRLVFANLLDNAIDYNRPGGHVEVALRPGQGQWTAYVRDTGIGMPRQELDRIFERFYRVDVARSREMGHTGLGLAIVKHAVEQHGGRIAVDSLLGEGTTFTVVLPVAAPS